MSCWGADRPLICIKQYANEFNRKGYLLTDGFFYVIAGYLIIAYSERRLFTGFATAAFIAWKLTVSSVISKAPMHDTTKTHQEIVA